MIVLVPGVLALLPSYAGLVDPVAPLRAACLDAVSSFDGPVSVVGTPQGVRVGESLLVACGRSDTVRGDYLVVANGSACRTEKAPGHLDERAAAFDAAIERALLANDADALAALDETLATELWADVAGLRELAGLLPGHDRPTVHYADDPFGVQYWVMSWQTEGEQR
ncbi:hypothetical protein [Nocardioides sp. LS1]|uniref:hypothetical protein n=1 Tax=Nocardioides sp. LS1 TaxID=1027620 RepID=UPI000FFB0597|nr:hypothetical protein [Nocardioides sp. LS1]GCD90699.1 hypothetical protein NLS1_27050 [Nocardioides sp. LS1]